MSYERMLPDAIPDSLLETIGTMHHAVRSMHDIDERMSNAMERNDLDPRLRNDLQCVGYATSAVMSMLALMGMTVKDVLKEFAKTQSSERKPLRDGKCGQKLTKGSSRCEIAEDVLRRRYPMCSEVELRNRAAYLTKRINMNASSKSMHDAVVPSSTTSCSAP